MRTRLICALALAAIGMAAPGPVGRVDDSATGSGSIVFGDGGHGRGFFDFDVVDGNTGDHGRFLFGGEDHHSYPEIVIRVQEVLRVDIRGRTVRIKARGTLQRIPVVVVVVAVDNIGTGVRDDFSVETTPLNGADDEGRFHASGKVFKGNVHVGPLE